MVEKTIILYAKQWSMTDEETGELRRGTSLWYVPHDMRQVIDMEDELLGQQPAKVSQDFEFYNTLIQAGGCPVAADFDWVLRTRQNKKVTVLNSVKITGPVKAEVVKNG